VPQNLPQAAESVPHKKVPLIESRILQRRLGVWGFWAEHYVDFDFLVEELSMADAYPITRIFIKRFYVLHMGFNNIYGRLAIRYSNGSYFKQY
jgi:hypothetical protein